MKRDIITLPRSIMRLLSCDWTPDWRGQSLGDTSDGVSTAVYNAFPRWTGSPTVYLRREAIFQWRAIRASAQGRRHIYRVPMVDPLGFDWQSAAGQLGSSGVSFSGGQSFANGVGYAYVPVALAVGAFAAGAGEITLDVSLTGVAPKVGQIMSAADWPFMVTSILSQNGTQYSVTIEMPLRAPLADGDPIRLEGVGLFEAVEEGMGNPVYTRNHVARPQMKFQEVLNR